jgi:molecular chaperone GrpE
LSVASHANHVWTEPPRIIAGRRHGLQDASARSMNGNMTDQSANDQSSEPQEESAGSVELDELRRDRDALQDRLLRLAAEFENYRKRVERDRRDVAELAAADAVHDLLPIVDNLERALQAEGSDGRSLRKGVELIHKQMLELLRKRNVTTIDALGADFDPNVHEAVAHEESHAHRDGEVMEELQRGYRLGERLLRAAMVKVAKRP